MSLNSRAGWRDDQPRLHPPSARPAPKHQQFQEESPDGTQRIQADGAARHFSVVSRGCLLVACSSSEEAGSGGGWWWRWAARCCSTPLREVVGVRAGIPPYLGAAVDSGRGVGSAGSGWR